MTKEKFIQRLQTVNLKNKEVNYNFLDVIKKEDNENIVSQWLAFLFDSKKCGSTLPLKLFCYHLNVEFIDGAVVDREYTLDNRRRIDIIIKLKKVWIVIENKINSLECNEQTVDYEDKISKEAEGQDISIKYVYLKPTYNKSKPANDNFMIMTYGDLADIWKTINGDDFTPKENHVYFSEL